MSRDTSIAFLTTAALLMVSCATPPAAKPMETVTVTGRGASASAALEDAKEAALDRVAGAVVDAKTLVLQGALVEQITSETSAFIESIKQLRSGITTNGAHFVEAQVSVRARQLKARVEKAQGAAQSVSGESLVARGLSQTQNERAAVEFMRKNSAGYPHDLISLRPIGELEILDRTGEEWCVGITVEVALQTQAWDHFSRMMRAALETVATRQWTWSRFDSWLGPDRHDHHRPRGVPLFMRRSGDTPWINFDKSPSSATMLGDVFTMRAQVDPRGFCMDLLAQKQVMVMLHETSQWTSEVASFEVPAATVDALMTLDPRLIMTLSLKDSAGNTVCQRFADLTVAPTVFHFDHDMNYWPAANVAPELDKWDQPHATWTLTSKSAAAVTRQRAKRMPTNPQRYIGYPGASWSSCVLTVMPGFRVAHDTGTATYTQSLNLRLAMRVPRDTLEKVAEVEVRADA